MFTFVFRVLAALLILCGSADAADQTVLQTSSLTDISGITAYGNTLVLGASRLSTADSGEEATGAVYITYYDDSSADYNLLSSGGLSETKLLNPYKAGQFGNPRADANGHGGFG
jgi:ABC-type sugar transport system substrate-binding protein